MCLSKIKSWFCGKCEPQIIEVEKIVTKEVEVEVEKVVTKEVEVEKIVTVEKLIKVPSEVVNNRITPHRLNTSKIDMDNNIKVYDYLYSLKGKCGYYSSLSSINTIKINRSNKTIILNDSMRLYSDGSFC